MSIAREHLCSVHLSSVHIMSLEIGFRSVFSWCSWACQCLTFRAALHVGVRLCCVHLQSAECSVCEAERHVHDFEFVDSG